MKNRAQKCQQNIDPGQCWEAISLHVLLHQKKEISSGDHKANNCKQKAKEDKKLWEKKYYFVTNRASVAEYKMKECSKVKRGEERVKFISVERLMTSSEEFCRESAPLYLLLVIFVVWSNYSLKNTRLKGIVRSNFHKIIIWKKNFFIITLFW